MDGKFVEVSNLKKYFHVGKRQILKAVDDVSFSIERGSTLGLVGESGCGKTTVGRHLCRIYEPDEGAIRIDGRDISHISQRQCRELAKKVQMIFQDPYASLNSFFTVGEIIGEAFTIHKMFRSVKERRDRIRELLEIVGLSAEHANRFPHEFSGGQRQRIGIARALALSPELIVCDEAISALDVSIQAQIVNMLIEFQRTMNLTYLFIAHDLSMVRHIADDTAVMYLGALVEYGATDAVYGHPAHPYTKGLLSAVPTPDPVYERSHRRIVMEGEVSDPINPEPGCRFYARCREAEKLCGEVAPPLKKIGGNHMVACHACKEKEGERST
ncbi:MAG: ATP-binding cassette domain-containing protein [Clostridiales Family XIII bacterium]|jgi:oligopeptide transport system ATP-binding protein|nr:ATP-binding cassette domain-containing protein [Clostridiales Family XIII bacterium]